MVAQKRTASEMDEESSDASSNTNTGSPQQDDSDDSGSRRSSSIPEELSPSSIRDQLRYCLADVKYVGSFTASQVCQKTVDPGLHVNGVGNISLPLGVADAEAITKACTQAPFGRGSETVIDVEFRNTKELNPSQFRLRNPAWEHELQDIVAHLGKMLGFQSGTSHIKPELYKLLLYEKGGMFKAHKDSEKAEGMFGTLVICLPSEHSGGSVVLSHHGETVVYETAAASEFGQSHIAWYSDVIHEIKPVESGYRLVLTYNLIRTGYSGPTSASVLVDEKAKFQRILSDWKQRVDTGQPTLSKLAWILDHKYSEANTGLNNLKGHDDLLGRYMAEICEKEGFTIMFATMTLTVFEASRELYDDDDELVQELVLSDIYRADGKWLFNNAIIVEEQIIQADCFHRDPDKIDAEETGNEGVDETHFYHDAVVLVMPNEVALDFTLAHLSTGDVMKWIRQLIDSLEHDPEQKWRTRLIQTCRREANNLYKRRSQELMASVIEACTALEDAQEVLMAIEGCSASRPGSSVHFAVAQALHVLPFDELKPSLDELTRYDTNLHLNLIAISNICSHYQERKVDNETLSELPALKAWEKTRIEDVIRRAEKLEPDDAPQLVNVLKRPGTDLVNGHILPLLEKHKSCTEAVISCLTEILEAGCRGEISQDTAEFIFGQAVHATTSALSFRASYPIRLQKEPETHSNFIDERSWVTGERWKETKLVKRVVRFYCQCLTTHHENDATAVLDWLRHEVDTAEIRIFHEFVFPFLLKLHGAMQDCSLSVSATQQEACQYMVLAFLNRCVGMEPAKPSTWTRSIRGCRDAACLLCPKLHEFLQNPEMEIGYLEDGPGPYGWSSWNKGHLYDQTSWWHESTPHHKMGDGSEMLRIKKLDKEWADTHDAWKRRYGKVTDALKHGLIPSRPLLGEKYEELVKMRPIKISTGK